MSGRLRVLVASRVPASVRTLSAALTGRPELAVSAQMLSNGSTDPLNAVSPLPDVLVLRHDPTHPADLIGLSEAGRGGRVPIIVVGPGNDANAVRMAMRAGARDYLPEPVDGKELVAALLRIREELHTKSQLGRGALTAVIGVGGGAGASFVACNVAHLSAVEAHRKTLIMDFDLNFSPQLHFLDLRPARGLMEALTASSELDEHALAGFVGAHRSGLHALGVVPRNVILSRDVDAQQMARLVSTLCGYYQHVVIDTPRQFDAVNATVLGMASTVLMVMQQSVMDVRNAARMAHILVQEIGLPAQRVRVVLNRYDRGAAVSVEDIRASLPGLAISLLPGDYQLAITSLDRGEPIYERDPGGAVTRALLNLTHEVLELPPVERPSLLRRALPQFGRRNS